MKKLTSLILALVLIFSLCACGGNGGGGETGTPAEQYQKLETTQWQKFATLLSNTESASSGFAGSGTMDITLGDSLFSFLPVGTDLTWLNKLNLSYDVQMKNDLMKYVIGIGLNDKNVLSVNLLGDMAKATFYFALPELSDKYIKIDGSVLAGDAAGSTDVDFGATNELLEILELLEELKLPEGKELGDLVMKYVRIVLGKLSDVTLSTETVKLNGKDVTLSAYNVKITEKTATDVLIAVLTEAKTDEVIKGILPDATEYVATVDALLAQLTANTEFDTESYFNLITYSDKKGEVVGRKLTLTEGTDTILNAHYFIVGDSLDIGFVSENSGVSFRGAAGNYALYMVSGGQELALIDIKYTGNDVKGTLTLTPTAFITQSMLGSATNVSLVLSWEQAAKSVKYGLNLYLDSALLLGLSCTATEGTPGDITLPSDAIDATDETALMNFLSTLDLSKILFKLTNAGIPLSFVESLLGAWVG